MAYVRLSRNKYILGVELKEVFPCTEIKAQLFIRRLQLNMDRVYVSVVSGYTPQTIERWENNPRRTIPLMHLVDWANALGYDLQFKLTRMTPGT
jgi:hypothetical protein